MDFKGLEHDPLAIDCKKEVHRQIEIGSQVYAVQLHELLESYVRGTLIDKETLINKLNQCRAVRTKG